MTHQQRSSCEAAARRDGFSEFQITERQSQGQMVPAARRAEYFPVYYVEPYAGNELALGFDLASNSARQAAISRSRNTGKLTATARVTLVQDREKQNGVVVFALVNSASDVILIVDHQGLITFANRQVENIFGYQIAEILGQPHDILLPEGFRDIHARHRATYRGKSDAQHMAEGRQISGLHKNGTEFQVEVGLSPFNTETNPQVISIVRDISERKRSEEALRKSEERYRTLVSNLDTGVVVHASDTRILLANSRAQELLGLTEDQMLGKKDIDPAWHFLCGDGRRLPTEEYPVNVVISTRKPLTNYVAGIKNPKAKDIVWVIINAFPEYDENYLLKQIVVTFWDYTQLKFAEAALAKRTNDLAKANRELQGQITERKLIEKELSKKQQQLAKDLEVAAGIQQSLIPSYSPRIESIRVAWRFEPCEQIGGDTFNFQYTGRNHISFYMLDVCGHGVSSALISAAASQFLQTNYELSANASEAVQPEAVLNSLERIFPFERFDSFFTIVYVTVDYDNGRLVYSCAGHPPPIILHLTGSWKSSMCTGLSSEPVLAGLSVKKEICLEHGDKIILYTDGVLDHPNPAGKIFGKQRFYDALQKHGRKPVATLMDSVQMTIKDFAGPARSGDDLSMMAVEYV